MVGYRCAKQKRSMTLTVAPLGVLFSQPAALVADAGKVPDLSAPALIERGRARFGEACSICHGDEGSGGAGPAPAMRGRTDLPAQEIFDTITNGRISGFNMMPSWIGSLSEEERWELAAYIYSLRGN